VLNAKVRDGRSQGFRAAVAMMKEGKSIKDLEDAVLGKHKRSA